MRLLALSLLLAACSAPVPGGGGAGIPTPADGGDIGPPPGTGGTATPTPTMASGDPELVVPHPDGVAQGDAYLAGSDVPTVGLADCTIYTEPGETEAQATVIHNGDGETLTVDFMPYARLVGAESCPAPGPDSYRIGGDGEWSGRFEGLTSRQHTTLFTISYAQFGGQLKIYDGERGAAVTSLSFWDGDISPTVVSPNMLVFDVWHGMAEEEGVDCPSDPDAETAFVVERVRFDLDARTSESDGLRCIQ